MKIPLAAPEITEEDIRAVADVLRGTRLSMGERLEEFERRFAAYVDAPHAVAVNSGTSALHLSLLGLAIAPGDEVIAPSFAFAAVGNAVRLAGATPVFVEIDPRTLTLDPGEVERALGRKTRAILAVHTFGCPAEMDALLEIGKRHGVPVIEDACEALGAEYRGRKTGSLGAAGVFAFYPNKQITTGEGGMLVTPSAELAARARSLRNQGRRDTGEWFEHTGWGASYRLSEMNCALGIEQLKRIESTLSRREAIALSYQKKLARNPFLEVFPSPCPQRRVSWFTYPVQLCEGFTRGDRDDVVAGMAARGIECGRYFAPIHLQPAFRGAARCQGSLALTEAVASRILALPLFNRITEDQVAEVCDVLSCLCESRQAESRRCVPAFPPRPASP